MNIEHDQFIGIYKDAFSKDYCDAVIKYFEKMQESGYALNRQDYDRVPKFAKDDAALFSTNDTFISLSENTVLMRQFNEVLWNTCYKEYSDRYWILKEFTQHGSYAFKIQKTEPGQGYHVWHCESSARSCSNRILVWNLYLNDVAEGGETEFINQRLRVKPETGKLVIWPAGFTHTHRGNAPLSGTKYIVTGWIEF